MDHPSLPSPGRLTRRKLVHPHTGQPLDEAMIVFFQAPATYTGEDLVEFHLHGNPVLVNLVLELLTNAGARPAQPGEFTLRAFLNGKQDLTQAEAVHDLVMARTPAAVSLAAGQLTGAVRKHLEALHQQLMHLVAELDAELDFPDDVQGLSDNALADTIARLETMCRRLADSYLAGRQLKDGFRVALVGAPNAGKSSLFNALLGRKRALVTPEAGTTRDYLEEPLPGSANSLVVVDTAGLRSSSSTAEQAGVQQARQIAADADLICFLVDSTRPWNRADQRALETVQNCPGLALYSKSDCPQHVHNGEDITNQFGLPMPVSSQTGDGLEELKEKLENTARERLGNSSGAALLTSARQRDAVRQAAEILGRLRTQLDHLPRDVIAMEVRQALSRIHNVTGEGHLDEGVLNMIFSSFCIGK